MTAVEPINEADHLLELQNVSKVYRLGAKEFLAFRDMNLRLKPGEFACLLGPSGCGKSTLLRIIAGLIRPPLAGCYIEANRSTGSTRTRRLFFRRLRFTPG